MIIEDKKQKADLGGSFLSLYIPLALFDCLLDAHTRLTQLSKDIEFLGVQKSTVHSSPKSKVRTH